MANPYDPEAWQYNLPPDEAAKLKTSKMSEINTAPLANNAGANMFPPVNPNPYAATSEANIPGLTYQGTMQSPGNILPPPTQLPPGYNPDAGYDYADIEGADPTATPQGKPHAFKQTYPGPLSPSSYNQEQKFQSKQIANVPEWQYEMEGQYGATPLAPVPTQQEKVAAHKEALSQQKAMENLTYWTGNVPDWETSVEGGEAAAQAQAAAAASGKQKITGQYAPDVLQHDWTSAAKGVSSSTAAPDWETGVETTSDTTSPTKKTMKENLFKDSDDVMATSEWQTMGFSSAGDYANAKQLEENKAKAGILPSVNGEMDLAVKQFEASNVVDESWKHMDSFFNKGMYYGSDDEEKGMTEWTQADFDKVMSEFNNKVITPEFSSTLNTLIGQYQQTGQMGYGEVTKLNEVVDNFLTSDRWELEEGQVASMASGLMLGDAEELKRRGIYGSTLGGVATSLFGGDITKKIRLSSEQKQELLYHALTKAGASEEFIGKAFEGKFTLDKAAITKSVERMGKANEANLTPEQKANIATQTAAAGVYNLESVQNVSNALTEAMNMDFSTPEGKSAMLNAMNMPIQLPPGYSWNAAAGSLVRPVADIGDISVGTEEGAEPTTKTPPTVSPEEEAQVTAALKMREMAAAAYEQATGQVPEFRRIEAQKAMQTERLQAESDIQAAQLARDRASEEARIGSQEGMQTQRLDREDERLRRQQAFNLTEYEAKITADAAAQGRQITADQARQEAEIAFRQAEGEAERSTEVQIEQMRQDGSYQQRVADVKQRAAQRGHEITMQEAEHMLRQQMVTDEVAGRSDVASIQRESAREVAQIRAGSAVTQAEADKYIADARQTGELQRVREQINAQAMQQGQQLSFAEAEGLAERQLKQQLQLAQGQQATQQISARGEQERQTLELQQAMAAQERTALRINTGPEMVAQARDNASQYTATLNSELSKVAGGDYSTVETALSAMLPPTPSGIAWDSQAGRFQQRAGFEGREMDFQTQQWMAAVAPAFKARDRAEQAVNQARTINMQVEAARVQKENADNSFREAMLTADIDSAEEAIARQKMAETAQIENETKLQNVQMLFSLLQNPVQLGMAKRHGLLGQIESALGFTLNNVPSAPAAGAGVPNVNEWNSLDNEDKAFRLSAFVEGGGSPDEFMSMISSSAPAQMQQVQYGVL